MITCFKNFLLTACLLLPRIVTVAQSTTQHEWELEGKLVKYNQVPEYVHKLKGISSSKASSLEITISQVLAVLYQQPQLNPPRGFDAVPFISMPRWTGGAVPEPLAELAYYFRYLVKDKHTGRLRRSMDGVDFHADINGLEGCFDHMGNFREDCSKLHFPLFFEEVPVTAVTPDYIEINFSSYGYPYVFNNAANSPVRIVLANHAPLFIPLTQKEFLQFLIAKQENELKEEREISDALPQQMAEAKAALAQLSSDPAMKKDVDKTIKSYEDAMQQQKEKLKKLQDKQERCRAFMRAMPAQEAAAPARLDRSKHTDGFVGLEQLVPAGRKEGVLLTRVNPRCYDQSSRAPAAQSITIYYNWPSNILAQDIDPLQQAAIDIFKHLNYHMLKESMQQ